MYAVNISCISYVQLYSATILGEQKDLSDLTRSMIKGARVIGSSLNTVAASTNESIKTPGCSWNGNVCRKPPQCVMKEGIHNAL